MGVVVLFHTFTNLSSGRKHKAKQQPQKQLHKPKKQEWQSRAFRSCLVFLLSLFVLVFPKNVRIKSKVVSGSVATFAHDHDHDHDDDERGFSFPFFPLFLLEILVLHFAYVHALASSSTKMFLS